VVRAEVGQYLPDWHPEEDYRTGVSARRDTGGGVLLDLSHEIDYVTALFGPARSVTGFVGHVSELEIETEDLAELVLECSEVPVASIRLDYLQRSPTRRCQVIGERGTLEWNYLDASVSLFGPDGLEERWEEPGFHRHKMYEAQMEHFLRCVAGIESPEVSAGHALHSLEVIAAARTAARTGRRQTLDRASPTGDESVGR
jgi:predicted dehydrogenase